LRRHTASCIPHRREDVCSSSEGPQRAATKDFSTPPLLPVLQCLSVTCSPRPAWSTKVCEGANGSDEHRRCRCVANLCPPRVVTLCCEDVLELGDEFFRTMGFSGAEVRPRARFHHMQVFIEPSSLLRLVFEIVCRHCSREWFTAAEDGASAITWSWSLTFPVRTFCRAGNSVLIMCSLYLWEILRSGSTWPFAASRVLCCRAVTTVSHLSGITSSVARVSRDDRGRAPGLHSDTSYRRSHGTWCLKSTRHGLAGRAALG
jgi:hypothetical protein